MTLRCIGVLLVVWSLCDCVSARDIFMDSPTACGQTFPAGEREIFIVRPRGSVSVPNPPTACRVHFESSYASSNYKFEIVVESAAFKDCGVSLSIFDGMSTGNNYIRMLGCGSTTSTGHFYSKDRAITLLLTRTTTQYFHGSNFQLKVQLYFDTEANDEFIGTYKVPAGAIVGIVLGIVVLVAAAILLGWCYKTGRLPGLSPYEYPSNTGKAASTENLSKSDINSAPGSNNGGFVSWHNKESKSVESRSNFDLSDTRIWESLTSVNTNNSMNNTRREPRPVGPVRVPNVNRNNNNDSNNRDRANQNVNTRKPFERLDAKQLSNSPTTRRGGRLNTETEEKDQYHTINDMQRENTRNETFGKGARNTRDGNTDKFVNLNPDKEGYMYDYDQVKKLSGEEENTTKPKTQDFGSELRDAIKRASMKRQKSQNDSDTQGLSGTDTQNESSAFSSAAALNKQTDGETTGPEAQSSPKPTKKKKRKNSKEKKKSGKKKDISDSPKKSKLTDSDDNNEDVPPELYAPIFSGDDEPSEPHNQYQPGYQGYQPPVPQYDPRYPMGGYGPPGMPPAGMYPPGMPGVPYQQAGQAQWYVESNPNGQQKMAFAMTTHSQSDDSLQGQRGYPPGPNYTSTPYNNTGAPRGHGNNDLSIVPAGTILDDPQIPAPGTSLMRYDEDPLSGVKASQVVWTDAKKDITDPPPDSATQITRKTITRITTRATEDELPDAPNPSLQDMSWRTAQGIQAHGGQEPAFMSPTRSAYQPNAIQYAPETPERSNAGYYTGGTQTRAPHVPHSYMPGTGPPVIHEAPKGNNAIRDRITLHSESDM